MKNKINYFTTSMLMGLTAITALCMAPAVSGKSSHSGGSQGGGSGGGLPFYATASTVNQLITDINYANSVGGAITINLAAGAIFDLRTADNATDGGNLLPVIGGTKAVALTIIGNGATIRRIAVYDRYGGVKNPFRLFDVVTGASLTLGQVTSAGGDAILNRGTVNVINGSFLSGGIDNVGGTMTVNDSTVFGHTGNAGGTVTVNNSTLAGGALYYGGAIYNSSTGTVTINNSLVHGTARFGGGIYNDGGRVTLNSSVLSGSSVSHYDYPWLGGYGGGIYNGAGTVVIDHSTLTGNTADPGTEYWVAVGGGIFNDTQGTVIVENDSHITVNLYDDVNNLNVLYLDSTSTIGILDGNSAIPF